MNMDPDLIAAAVTNNTRAILPVDVFGQPCAMDKLTDCSDSHGLVLLEDACEAIGAEYRGRKVGTFGKAAVFGFYPNKQMTMGEGGIITTNDAEWAALFRSLRNQGRSEMGTWLCHERLGFNYRLDEMSAALGFSQLSRIDELLDRRANVAAIYNALLRNVRGVTLLSPVDTTTRMSWFVLIVGLDENVYRDEVIHHSTEFRHTYANLFFPSICNPISRKNSAIAKETFPLPNESQGARSRCRSIPISRTRTSNM